MLQLASYQRRIYLLKKNQILYVFLSFFRYKKFILDEMAKQKMNNEHRLGHSLGKKKTIWFFLWFFIFQTYRKYGSILLGHFIKHKYLIVEECCTIVESRCIGCTYIHIEKQFICKYLLSKVERTLLTKYLLHHPNQ